MSDAALQTYLEPLNSWLQDPSISEILINQPEKIFIERDGLFVEQQVNALNFNHLMGLANLIARHSEQRLSEKEPLLSGILPSGHRIQIILPPATKQNSIVISIRKQTIKNVSLDDYEKLGSFQNTQPSLIKLRTANISKDDKKLQVLFKQQDYVSFLKQAIKSKKNILISGATSTGKTTFLNACLQAIPLHEHIVTLEDVPEVKPPHPLHTSLFASKGLQGVAKVTMQDLVQASLRIRPDRIILGELRGSEAADFINATATGHDGSISSLHASSPLTAFMRLTHMVKLSDIQLTRKDILSDLYNLIDIVVQLKRRLVGDKYIREVSEIYYADA